MLLRRITRHVSEQNWFAVAIDFAIVVGGVFIGIQVANWNDARLEHSKEIAALEELLAEAELNVGMIKSDFEFNAQTIKERDGLVAKLTSGDLEGVTESDVGRLIGDSRQYPGIPAVSAVYDGFVGSGVVGSLSDREAVQSVARYHALVDGLSNATENFQSFVIEEYPHFSEYPGIRAVYDAERADRRRYDIDLATFISTERTLEDIVSLNRNQISFHGLRRAQLTAAESMCAELARARNRECTPRLFQRGENGQLIPVDQ